MARSDRPLDRLTDRLTFGGRLPWGAGLILVVTVVASLVVAFAGRHVGFGLVDATALRPYAVLQGQVWRLFTWVFIQPDLLWLVFGALALWWFGGALGNEWGSRRFLAVWGGVTLVTAVGTCIVGLVDSDVFGETYIGSMALSDALLVAWGLTFPDRTVRIYFVLPIRGFWLAWGTVALTVAASIYSGWAHYLPMLVADAAMLAWLYSGEIRHKWKTAGRQRQLRAADAKRNAVASKRKASAAHLRVIEGGDHEPPPLPPELEERIGRLLSVDQAPTSGRAPKKDRPDDE